MTKASRFPFPAPTTGAASGGGGICSAPCHAAAKFGDTDVKKLDLLLMLAQNGLLTAALALERDGSAKSRKLAKALRSAHAGIEAYLAED